MLIHSQVCRGFGTAGKCCAELNCQGFPVFCLKDFFFFLIVWHSQVQLKFLWSFFAALCKPFLHLTVIQVGWKARRCTWSLRMSFTTRSSQRAVLPPPINRTALAAQASLPPTWARQRRGHQRIAVSVRNMARLFWMQYLKIIIVNNGSRHIMVLC